MKLYTMVVGSSSGFVITIMDILRGDYSRKVTVVRPLIDSSSNNVGVLRELLWIDVYVVSCHMLERLYGDAIVLFYELSV